VTTPHVLSRLRRGNFALMTFLMAGTILLAPWPARGQDPPPNPTPVGDGADPQGAPAPAADPGDPNAPQVLTRGPIHEAFAAPVVHDPAAGPIIPKQPPDPIQEMPPDQKPAGQNVQWIPGYWSWDVSRDDYLWVSGIWRDPPPNSQWVPGYWHQVQGGSQWVSGTWIPVSSGPAQGQAQASGQGQPAYLPQAPPASLENGPTTPQPGPNVAWTPGYWSWQGSSFAWRPGFWGAVQPNWIWMPAHYVWTPSGYLFVGGYWDMPVANRGLMFAPVYYPQPVYAQPNFMFTPSITIAGPAVTANLFVSAGTNQYLFGNFYAQNFLSVGITPWFSFSIGGGRPAFFDPLFSYYAVVNIRQNPGWIAQVRRDYILRRDNIAMRPPITYAEQTRLIERNITIDRNMAMPLNRLAAERGMRLEHVSEAERQLVRQKVAQLHNLRDQRVAREREGARARAAGGAAARPRPMNLPHSPIAAHPAARAAATHAAAAQHAEAQRAAAAHAAASRAEATHASEAQRQAAHSAGAERREGATSRTAPRAGTAARRGATRETPRSAASSRGRSRPSEEEEQRRPE
jgi:WXXGXW repeat (2 copies)